MRCYGGQLVAQFFEQLGATHSLLTCDLLEVWETIFSLLTLFITHS